MEASFRHQAIEPAGEIRRVENVMVLVEGQVRSAETIRQRCRRRKSGPMRHVRLRSDVIPVTPLIGRIEVVPSHDQSNRASPRVKASVHPCGQLQDCRRGDCTSGGDKAATRGGPCADCQYRLSAGRTICTARQRLAASPPAKQVLMLLPMSRRALVLIATAAVACSDPQSPGASDLGTSNSFSASAPAPGAAPCRERRILAGLRATRPRGPGGLGDGW